MFQQAAGTRLAQSIKSEPDIEIFNTNFIGVTQKQFYVGSDQMRENSKHSSLTVWEKF